MPNTRSAQLTRSAPASLACGQRADSARSARSVFLHHVRSKKSVRLYFVPVVPYGTDDYLVCPVCSQGLQISNAQLRYTRSMSDATAYAVGRSFRR
jgi:hypothetical protein